MNPSRLRELANALRALAMDAVQQANSGHPGMPMGMADVAAVLFARHLKFDPSAADWPDRDRFVLSAGHGSMLLYGLLYLSGYPDIDLNEIRNFRQLGSKTPGHPEYGHAAGVETTTGPLGQGLANAVGMALAERMLAARFGGDIVDHHTYVIAGDGCLMEGISHEAISLAGHLRLNKLIVLFDDNGISIDGPTSLSVSDDQGARFRACGWNTLAVDGHDADAIDRAITEARHADRPTMIACRTVIGFGSPNKAGSSAAHGAPLGEAEIAAARAQLGWSHGPFEIPQDIVADWREFGSRGEAERQQWQGRLAALESGLRGEFERMMAGDLPAGFDGAVGEYKRHLVAEQPGWATRKSSQEALEVMTQAVPEMIGGSADLTGSNNTKTAATAPVSADDFGGRYLYYGVREHGMAAAMNGMALHGGFMPYGGTFLVFSDYCRPSIRLAALMGLRVVFVMTHDSIGLGEDGPTHQPVEQLAALRAIPNLNVFRPADAVETAECWQLAVQSKDRPAVIALTRQGLAAVRLTDSDENLCGRGAYVLAEAKGGRQITLLATGSEIGVAMAARELLQAQNIGTTVVSMPCQELFDEQPADYREAVLGSAPRIAIEAAIEFGWRRYLGDKDVFIGMHGFGASAPIKALYEHFGITAARVVEAARNALS
ncbi:MAG: transketolase [Alphaproteobacteria bacterium]